MYVTSRIGGPHMMLGEGQLAQLLVFKQAKNLLYNRISFWKGSRATKLEEQSGSGGLIFQTCDDIRVLQFDWPAKICAHGPKIV